MNKIVPLSIGFLLFANVLMAAEGDTVPEVIQEENISLDGEAPIDEAGLDLDSIDPDLIDLDGNERASDENFVPSIRITEDLPVAFPIDI
ncbi:MAG: hypothetical protein P8M72_11240 [Gammaproteobacteria bacterium]|nr:hypothetical protein [Gammaproteobacteria bacterium]